jgi:hypothetical protein
MAAAEVYFIALWWVSIQEPTIVEQTLVCVIVEGLLTSEVVFAFCLKLFVAFGCCLAAIVMNGRERSMGWKLLM